MKKLMIIIPTLVVLVLGGTVVASTDILKSSNPVVSPIVQSQSEPEKTEITPSPVQTTTPQAVAKVGVTKLTIEETLTSVLGDRIISKSINPLGPEFSANAKGVLVTFKYLEKDNVKVDHEVAQLIRELAKTGENINMISIWVRSEKGEIPDEISATEFNRVNIQELALLSDTEMFTKAKKHSTDVSKAQ